MRWEFRNTSCLLSLNLSENAVVVFLAIQSTLTRLESLTLEEFDYSEEHAQQLLYLTSLKTLQVQYQSALPVSPPFLVFILCRPKKQDTLLKRIVNVTAILNSSRSQMEH